MVIVLRERIIIFCGKSGQNVLDFQNVKGQDKESVQANGSNDTL